MDETSPATAGRPVPESAVGTDRRTVLRTAVAGTGIVLSGALGAPWAAAAPRRRAYVLVLDGCRPDELRAEVTPNIAALRRGGMAFPRARSMPVMETLPNHAMMMTGVRPDRTGVPANSVYDPAEGEVRTLERPGDLRFPTVLGRLRRQLGLTTGSVLSKEYLYTLFGTRATYRWEPRPLVPITEHALDVFTMRALTAMVDEADPDLVFANLGDIDRFGHSDLTGTSIQLLRRIALAGTDALVGGFVDHLRRTGRWRSSMLIVLADHSMDWSTPDRIVSLARVFEDDPLLAGRVAYADNGGAELLTWTGAPARRERAVTRMRELARGVEGVLSLHSPDALRLGPRAGDLVAYCQQGWRFSDPDFFSNPIPGNHGHPATEPIPFFVAGGSPRVRRGTSSRAVSTLDVAPTLGAYFGLSAPRGGYDGRSVL